MRFRSVFSLFKPCSGILSSGGVDNPLSGNSYIKFYVWYLSFRYYGVFMVIFIYLFVFVVLDVLS